MNGLKKVLSLFAIVVSILILVPTTFASVDIYEIMNENVLYYTDFTTGTNEDLPEVENDKYYFYGRNDNLHYAMNEGMEYIHDSNTTINTHTYSFTNLDLQKSEFEGDVGARVRRTAGMDTMPVVMFDFRYKDADKTPTEEGMLSSGIYKFEFDFVLDGSNRTTNGFRVEANCKHSNCGNSFAWMMNNTWHNLSGGNTWSYTEKDIPITNNELHHYEIIFDLDNDLVCTYMDGERKKDTRYHGNINFLHLIIGGKMKFVDDIKFSQLCAKANSLCVIGDDEAEVGESGIIKNIVFATDKNANFVYCYLKYPDYLTVSSINAKDFAIVTKEEEITENGYTTLVLSCLYSETEMMPKLKTLTPVEIGFDVSDDAKTGIARIEILEDSVFGGNEVYSIEERLAGEIEIFPSFVENIEISGNDVVSEATEYTAVITPDYATNKEVAWSISDEKFATVDELGIVTPVASGKVTLTATAKDGSGVYVTKEIEVINLVGGIRIVGDDNISGITQYSAITADEYSIDDYVEWSVSDSTVATVSKDGILTPLKNGKVKLIVTFKNNKSVTVTKEVTVTDVSVTVNTMTSNIGAWDKEFNPYRTEYIIYAPEDATEIKLTSTFTDATMKINGTSAFNSIAKKITLSEDITIVEIVLTPTIENSLKSNTYTITIIKSNGTKTVDLGVFTFTNGATANENAGIRFVVNDITNNKTGNFDVDLGSVEIEAGDKCTLGLKVKEVPVDVVLKVVSYNWYK